MNPDRANTVLTEEIMDKFKLSDIDCREFISQRIQMAIGIGFNLGIYDIAHGKRPVSCISDGVIIKVYDSMSDAARDTGATKHDVYRHCKRSEAGRKYTPKGSKFVFRYKEPRDYTGKRVEISKEKRIGNNRN